MASLVLKMSVSLDGYVAPADGSSDWEAAGRSDDGARWTLDTVSNAATHLIGAATYARWAGFWPGRRGPFAKPMNEIPKVVFSNSLASADWGPDDDRDAETWPQPSRASSRSAPTDTCSPRAASGSPARSSRPA